MVELSKERMEQMLHEETAKKEDQGAILRAVYTRYMQIFEKYIQNLDTLDDEQIAEMRKYHLETISLVKYYYMDIPHDVATGIREYEKKVCDLLLGEDWHKNLTDSFEEYKRRNKIYGKNEEELRAEYKRESLEGFYDVMDYVFRSGFGTESETAKDVFGGLSGLLFGFDKK